MKWIPGMVALLVLTSLTLAAEEEAPKKELKSPSEKLSYALGLEIGTSLKRLQTDIDIAVFTQALKDGFEGKKPLLTPQQAEQIKRNFFAQQAQGARSRNKALAEKNLKEGEAFLAKNKGKKGVVTTASGLQYVVLTEGDGPTPKATDRVKVHYRGTLIDGTEFDSSYKRGRPASFSANRVIPGWTEALQLMKVGSKYRLFIPSKLAYGERGAGPQIGPNTMLIFEVELLGIE